MAMRMQRPGPSGRACAQRSSIAGTRTSLVVLASVKNSRTDRLRQLLKGPKIIKVRGRAERGRAGGRRRPTCTRPLGRFARMHGRRQPNAAAADAPPQGPCCHDALSAKLIEQAGEGRRRGDFFLGVACKRPQTRANLHANSAGSAPAAAGGARRAQSSGDGKQWPVSPTPKQDSTWRS